MKKEKTQQWTKVKEDTHRKGDEEAEGIGHVTISWMKKRK